MELWIRSQNKIHLVHINGVRITNAHRIGRGKDELIYLIEEASNDTLLGEYATKERALEVLNEIQNLIFTRFVVEKSTYEQADIEVKCHILCNMSKIYEMPQE